MGLPSKQQLYTVAITVLVIGVLNNYSADFKRIFNG